MALSQTERLPTLDFQLLRRGFLWFFGICLFLSPFAPDPVAVIVGAAIAWLILMIIGTPAMPMAVVYLLLWQWMQVFARVLQSIIDGEPLSGGLYGPDVARAYWYMLTSLLTLAVAFRIVMSGSRPPTEERWFAHYKWEARDVFMVYLGSLVLAMVTGFATRVVPALSQPFDILSRIKIVALFLLFTYVLTTGRGNKFLLAAVLFEIAVGFTGFLSDFRGVFIYLGVAALASRVKWTGTATAAFFGWLMLLIVLALFWTSVKNDYRAFATEEADSQQITVPLADRMAYLGERLVSPGSIDWGETSYMLLIRLAYVDIFGAVIGVQEASPEPGQFMRQWEEAVDHVLRPRFLFRDKADLSDTEVYVRLARGDVTEEIRQGTSISVGYMAENFADLGFPGMLAGIFVLGLMIAGIIRYLMSLPLPWMLREGLVMAFAFTMSRDGVEVSLPKILGAMLMFVIVFSLAVKFIFPFALKWLDERAARARPEAA
ncbi:MAG: hypothetical protein K2Y40_10265 [Reyranella sp.]|nr:hypothetical protein [Reyranella sp.]